jgi:hypothetical protein
MQTLQPTWLLIWGPVAQYLLLCDFTWVITTAHMTAF